MLNLFGVISIDQKLSIMKAIKTHLKTAALFLSILILFQGCGVYHKGTRTLDEAVIEQKKVRITTLDNRTMHFKRVVFKDGKYYGVKKTKNNSKDVLLVEKDIKSLKSQNESLSTVLTIGIPIVLLGIIIVGGWKELGLK